MTAYYNEFDPYAAQWLRNLIAAGHLPAGDVDTRSIVDVQPDDLIGYTQCHFFAGIGGWGLAARLAGWPDDRELWTGSPPCQPFSVAGKGKAQGDDRHLWPHYFRLIRARRPDVVMGEQVAAAVGHAWLDGVLADLEGQGYAGRAVVVPACAVNAPHRRDRLWFVAHAHRLAGRQGDTLAGGCADGSGARQVAGLGGASNGDVGDPSGPVCKWVPGGIPATEAGISGAHGQVDGHMHNRSEYAGKSNHWAGAGWIIGHDGKARRVEPSIPLLAHGVSGRVGRLRAYGNAIVPQVAAEVIAACMETAP